MDNLIIFCAKYLFLAVVALYFLAIIQASPKHRKALVIAFVVAGGVAVVLDKIAGRLYYDPRPFISHHLKALIDHNPDNGFPSEHTVLTTTISAALIYYRRQLGILAFGLALLVGIGRVAAHVHSPIDIFGGILIGIAAGSSGYYLAERLLSSKRYGGRPVDSR
ncbi:phosphatase PAP2 family protein [Candidatus Saccharibacteria bacterium]|nr:phosphatase PAP2 family protein [Candidatus Saccharibacteria bacterium]